MSDDLISRKAAIDLFPDDDLECDTKGGYIAPHLARQMICELPFAQPETHDKRTETHACDSISRQAAIDIASGYCHPANIAKELEKLPSTQPEQRLSCKNCIHLGHGYMMPCKNCKRNQMLPDWYEVETERKKND